MSITHDELKTRIGSLHGAVLFYGSEEYLKDYYSGVLRKRVESSPLPEFNHTFFNAAAESVNDLEEAAFSLPYMWETKLIEVNEIQNVKLSEDDCEGYARVFADLPEYVTVLIVLRGGAVEEKELGKKKSGLEGLVRAVEKTGTVVSFDAEKPEKLRAWITRHFDAQGLKFDPAVTRELLAYCGTDMYVLRSELEKLSVACGGRTVKTADIYKYCCGNATYKYYDIVDALARRDMLSAKRILDSLDLSRTELTATMGTIAKSYSEMLLVKTGLESGRSESEVASDLKMPVWRVKKTAASAAGSDKRRIAYAIARISDADNKLKSFSGNPDRIIENAFYRICAYGK